MAFCGRASRAILRGNDKSARIITRNGFENSFSHRGHQTFFRASRSRGAAPHAAHTSERGQILAVAAQVVLVAPLQDVVEFGKQARPVCRQNAFQKEGVRHAHKSLLPLDVSGSVVQSFQLHPVFGTVSSRAPSGNAVSCFVGVGNKSWDRFKNGGADE